MKAMAIALLALWPGWAAAGPADVVEVEVKTVSEQLYRFAVTVRHADEGWQHYADRWEVLGPDGKLLATRVLRHPHVDEQPFTRALPRVELPRGVRAVTVRAHDSVHGIGGAEITVELPD